MSDCIFCRIIKGEIPSHKVYEDEVCVAFFDINPLNKGHTMVVPKEHSRWVWDIEDGGRYFEAVQKIAKAIQKAFDTEYVISLVVGIDVPHAHTHLVPRFDDDGHGNVLDFKNHKKFSEDEIKAFAEQIRRNL